MHTITASHQDQHHQHLTPLCTHGFTRGPWPSRRALALVGAVVYVLVLALRGVVCDPVTYDHHWSTITR